MLNTKIEPSKKPLFLEIANAVRSHILKNNILPGEKIPSSRELAKEFNCHRHTIMSALDELIAEGWIESEMRKGYCVSKTLPDKFFHTTATPLHKQKIKKHQWIYGDISQPEKKPQKFKISLKPGPDLREFPIDGFKACMNRSMKKLLSSDLNYQHPLGHPHLINMMNIYLRRARSITGKTVVITHGSQEALFMMAHLLLQPGDKVAVEELGYKPVWNAFKKNGANLVTIKVDEGGLDVKDFEKKCQKHKFKLLYLTALYQYPTSTTLSIARRVELYEIAQKYDIPIIEDDYNHEYHYRPQPLPPIAAHDPAGLIIYISSFSTILFPSLRLGFMAIPNQLRAPFKELRLASTCQINTMFQETLASWMEEGLFERHLRKMRRLYHHRRDLLNDHLVKLRDMGKEISWKTPDGGLSMWVKTNMDTEMLSNLAANHDLKMPYENEFKYETTKQGSHFHIGFSHLNDKEIEQVAKTLKMIL